MMQPSERWILAGAAALAVGSILAVVKTVESRPESPAWVDALETRVDRELNAPSRVPATPDYLEAFYYNNRVEAGTGQASDWAGYLLPEPVGIGGPPPPPPPLEILPAGYPVKIGRTLEAVTLEWAVVLPEFDNPDSLPVKELPVTKIRIERSVNGGGYRWLADVDPGTRRFEDRDVKPLTPYAYRVIPVGVDEESVGQTSGVWTRTPSRQRVMLIGGDRRVAILRVERYDKGMWTGRMVTAHPGDVFGEPEWRLDALRFDKSTLEAVVTDDDGKIRTLKTRR